MRPFPIIDTPRDNRLPSIPWELIAPHEAQAQRNHGGQTLQRLAERGGLCPLEAVAVLKDMDYRDRWPHCPHGTRAERDSRVTEAIAELRVMVEKQPPQPAPEGQWL